MKTSHLSGSGSWLCCNFPVSVGLLAAVLCQPACSNGGGDGGTGGVGPATGGAALTGGAPSTGGIGSGGVATGGSSSGGSLGSGGQGTGGGSSGGAASGGAASGGAGSGGAGSGGAGTGGGSNGGFQPCPAAEPCKVLPLGDSITEGMVQVNGSYQMNGGYRVGLFERAVTASKDITFVGSRPTNGPDMVAGQPFPKDHEGTSGIVIQDLANKANKYADGPHIVLLHIGTNDLNGNQLNGSRDRLEAFVDQITTEVPDALLVVAQLIPLPSKANDVTTFNASVVDLVEEKAAEGKHILMVDMFSDYPSGQLPDSIHPSATGYDWMGGVWYDAIEPYLP